MLRYSSRARRDRTTYNNERPYVWVECPRCGAEPGNECDRRTVGKHRVHNARRLEFDRQEEEHQQRNLPLEQEEREALSGLGLFIRTEPTPVSEAGVEEWEVVRTLEGEYYAGSPQYGAATLRWFLQLGLTELVPAGVVLGQTGCSVSVGRVTVGEHAGGWVGFSHRAAAVFKVGGVIFDREAWRKANPDKNELDQPFVEMGVEPIETDEQARLSAARFAEEVA